jgi:predicted phage terminase large subunit-like protein
MLSKERPQTAPGPQGLNVIDVAATQSKEARAHIQTPKFASGPVLLPNSAAWLSALEAELLAFPAGRNYDQVDWIVQALAYEQVVKCGVSYIYLDRPKRDWRRQWPY